VAAASERPEAWEFEEAVFSPAVALDADFIDAGDPHAAGYFSYLGWGVPVDDAERGGWLPAVGPQASVFVDLPTAEPVDLRARLRAPPWALPQTVAVAVAGVPIGSWRIETTSFREYTLRIPGERNGGRATAISFRPEKFRIPGRKVRAAAFELDWIRLEGAAASH